MKANKTRNPQTAASALLIVQLFTEVLRFFTAGLHMNQQLSPNEDFYPCPNKPKAKVRQSNGTAALCTEAQTCARTRHYKHEGRS